MTRSTSFRFAAWGVKPVLGYAAMALFAGGLEAIDLGDCFINSAGSVRLAGAWSCPNVTPTLTVSTYYRCEECGEKGPREAISATGRGQCCHENICSPILDWVDYGIASMEIQIRNTRA